MSETTPSPTPNADYEAVTLPFSGDVVQVSRRRMSVKDLDTVSRLVGKSRQMGHMIAARLSLVVSKPGGGLVTMEEILDWDEDDMIAVTDKRDEPGFMRAGARTPSS